MWPIFNIADASIFVGVSIILIFQKHFFKEKVAEKEMASETVISKEVESEKI